MRISFSLLILSVVFFLGAAAIVHALLDWNVYASSPKLFLLYFGVPATVSLSVLVVSRQAEATRTTIASFIFSLAIALFGVEAVLIYLLPRFTLVPALLSGTRYDFRSRLEVVLSLREVGKDAHPDIYPAYLRTLGLKDAGTDILPLGKIPLTISVDGNEGGDFAVYETDEFGFRNPRGLYQPGQVELLLVGDSFIQGSCVRPGEEVAAQLRKNIPETISLGNGGNGPLLMLAGLKEYGKVLQPKKVVWGYYEGNDFRNLREEQGDPLLLKYLDPLFSQELVKRQEQINTILRGITSTDALLREDRLVRRELWKKGLKLFHLRELIGARAELKRENAATLAQRELFRRVIERAKELTNSWEGEFYFLYIPQYLRFAGSSLVSQDRDFVIRFVRELEIPVIDGLAAFQTQRDPLSLFQFRTPRAHYNAAGYQALANEIFRVVSEGDR